jgi:hypothetical protein
VAAWVGAVELCGVRAGLLACGDLELAVSLVRRHPIGTAASSDRARDDQVRSLLGFALSPAYTALRRHIGVLLER